VPADRVIGITGSAGKSTTSAMIAHLLDGDGRRAVLAGNIGGSLLERAPQLGAKDWLVLELSSFMLWWLGPETGGTPWLPRIGVLTNLADNHLDWHVDAAHYSRSKSFVRGPSQHAFISRFEAEDAASAQRFAKLPAGAWWRDRNLRTAARCPALTTVAMRCWHCRLRRRRCAQMGSSPICRHWPRAWPPSADCRTDWRWCTMRTACAGSMTARPPRPKPRCWPFHASPTDARCI
jgi:hypothetical protein